jgi:hypothetical protein
LGSNLVESLDTISTIQAQEAANAALAEKKLRTVQSKDRVDVNNASNKEALLTDFFSYRVVNLSAET